MPCWAPSWASTSATTEDGFRFGRLALDLVEKRRLDGLSGRVYQVFALHVAHWTQHLASCRVFLRRAFDVAQEAGDLTWASYARVDLVTNLLATGEPLGEIEREAEGALEFVQRARFGLISDVIVAQLRLIRTLRGLTPDFGSFNDAAFDEARFEQHLESNPRLGVAASRYWIRKLQARLYAGDGESALAALEKAAALLWTLPTQVELPEYHFYAALAQARAAASATRRRAGAVAPSGSAGGPSSANVDLGRERPREFCPSRRLAGRREGAAGRPPAGCHAPL